MQKSKLLVGTGLVLSALTCLAGWTGDNYQGGVNVSGTEGEYVYPLFSYSSTGSADATTTSDLSGVYVSGSVESGSSIISDAGATVSTFHTIAFAYAQAYGDYTWNGPAGYPNGPENFPIHISANMIGYCEGGSGAGLGCESTSGASYVGEASASGDMIDGGQVTRSLSGSVEGTETGTGGHSTYTVYGNSPQGASDPNGNNAWARSWLVLEEDYNVEDQVPPSLHLSVQMGSNSDVSITCNPVGSANAAADAIAKVIGSASITFGTAH